jgi:hypothetical protein
MESFLNFLWVLIALAALGTWRACWMHEYRSRRRDPVREWAAVICSLVLLFFAVSLSDDLHSNLVLLEEGAGGRKHAAIWDTSHPPLDKSRLAAAHPPGALSCRIFFPRLSNFALLRTSEERSSIFVDSDVQLGRAPPYFPLNTTRFH